MGTYRLTEADGLFWLATKLPKGWRTMHAFDLQPQIHADYVLGSWYASTFPQATCPQTLLMERLSHGRRHRLIDRRLVVEARDGEVIDERRAETADELAAVIDEIFGVTLPVTAGELWRRFE
jgi:N-hydroxyarylamine O-acetyltransferase